MTTLFHMLATTSAAVAATRSRNAKRDALAAAIARTEIDELAVSVCYLAGQLPQGRIGIGPAALSRAAERAAAPAPEATLGIISVHSALQAIKSERGSGSAQRRDRLLDDLIGRCTAIERRFLLQLVMGELRQGALEAVMVEAIAKANHANLDAVRRAFMFSGDLAAVVVTAHHEGNDGLARYRLTVGTPVQSMLAQPADDIRQAIDRSQKAARAEGAMVFDYKMDGARIQVHKSGSAVSVFSRQLNDVTAAVPEIVAVVGALSSQELVLDGEVIAFDSDAKPLPFQTTMRRFGRRQDVAAMMQSLPLSVRFFDCLHATSNTDLMNQPLATRLQVMDAALPAQVIMPRTVTDNERIASQFLRGALSEGHEGVMAKSSTAAYEAGKRGASWQKIKRVHTLDLVVLAAEWGSGRRRGYLSNLHLGARLDTGADGQSGFVMLGKTFKGLTDEVLAWQTKSLIERETHREDHVVYVNPELVVEVAFNDVQESPHYAAGLALRFARVKRYRPDKPAGQADTLAAVQAIHRGTRS